MMNFATFSALCCILTPCVTSAVTNPGITRDSGVIIQDLVENAVQEELNKHLAACNNLVRDLKDRIARLEKKVNILEADRNSVAVNASPSGNFKDLDESEHEMAPSSVHNITRVRRAIGAVAFTAYLSRTTTGITQGESIKFDQVLINDGNGYNPYTGAFTAPLTGTYLFTFNFHVNHHTFLRLSVNGANVVDATANPHNTASDRETMGGNTAVVHVQHGEAVLVEVYDIVGEALSSNKYRLCTFTGVLLY